MIEKLTNQQKRLLETSEIIKQEEAQTKDIAYMAKILINATLPHKDPGDVEIWQRKNGKYILSIQRGFYINEKTGETIKLGIPYGTLPRLLLLWIISEVKRTKCKNIYLGKSVAEFMRKLAIIYDGHSLERMKEQMRRLFRAHISIHLDNSIFENIQIVKTGRFDKHWWDFNEPHKESFRDAVIILSEDFYDVIINSTIPLDMRALKALRKSPLCLDLYSWLNYQTFLVNKHNEEKFINWEKLMIQIGGDYQDIDAFKFKVRQSLKKIELVAKGLNVTTDKKGINIRKGMVSIIPL